MSKIDLENVMSTTELAAFRTMIGDTPSTDQGIRSQLLAIKEGKKTEKEVGFKVIRHGKGIFIELIDAQKEAFRKKLMDYIAKNKPK
jgi:uncharacterized protein (DUF927 family)